MEIEFDRTLYMDQCALFIEFLLKKRQWSGIGRADYNRWKNNFKEIEDGDYIAVRIIDSLLYYSEDDMLKMMDDSIMKVYEKEVILPLQIEKRFSSLPSEVEYAVREAMNSTIVMPCLEDVQDPGASGPEIVRNIRNHFTPQLQIVYNHNLHPTAEYKILIIIDDCIGSGKQCETFWNEAEIREDKLLREWVKEKGVKAHYIALVGYKKTVEELNEKFSDITFSCAEYLSDYHQVFSDVSRCWMDNEEQVWAMKLLEEKLNEHGIELNGYSGLSFAVALHKTIPDWSLPMLFKNKNDWQHLLERKTTYEQ